MYLSVVTMCAFDGYNPLGNWKNLSQQQLSVARFVLHRRHICFVSVLSGRFHSVKCCNAVLPLLFRENLLLLVLTQCIPALQHKWQNCQVKMRL